MPQRGKVGMGAPDLAAESLLPGRSGPRGSIRHQPSTVATGCGGCRGEWPLSNCPPLRQGRGHETCKPALVAEGETPSLAAAGEGWDGGPRPGRRITVADGGAAPRLDKTSVFDCEHRMRRVANREGPLSNCPPLRQGRGSSSAKRALRRLTDYKSPETWFLTPDPPVTDH